MTTQDQIDELLKLTKENQIILKKLQRHNRLSMLGTALYWIFVIGFVFGAYYYLQPMIDILFGNILHLQSVADQVSAASINIPEVGYFRSFFEALKK